MQPDPERRAAQHQPGGVHLEAQQGDRRPDRQQGGREIDHRGAAELNGHHRHQCERCDVQPVEEGPRDPRRSQLGNQGSARRDEDERREEDPGRGHQGPPRAGQQIADERRGRKDRPRRHLTGGDRVDELRLREPVQPLNEIGTQKGDQDITAAEQDGADLQEQAEQPRQADRADSRRAGRRASDREEQSKWSFPGFPAYPYRGDKGRRPEQDRQLIDPKGRGHRRARTDEPQQRAAGRRGRQAPESLQDHRDDDRLHAPEQPEDLRPLAEPHIRPPEGAGDEHRRNDEAQARNHQPSPAALQPPDVNGHLRRVRPGDQVRGAEKIEKPSVGQPAAPYDDLGAHHGDVCRWPPEGSGPQAQEERHQLEERGLLNLAPWLCRTGNHTVAHSPGRPVSVL